MMGAGIAMAALVNHEGAAQMGYVELVGAQQVYEVDLSLLRTVNDAGPVTTALARQKAKV